MQKLGKRKSSDLFSALQPSIEVTYSQILTEIKTLYKAKPEWRQWVREQADYLDPDTDADGKEIREVLQLGSHVMAVTYLGVCYIFDVCK